MSPSSTVELNESDIHIHREVVREGLQESGFAADSSKAAQTSGTLRTLFEGWRTVAAVTVAGALLSVGLSLLLPVSYQASSVLFPSPMQQTPPSLAGGLLGLVLPQSATRDEALATLNSAKFLGEFIAKHNELPNLFSGEWNPATQSWKDGAAPSLLEAIREFRDELEVETSATSSIVTVSYFNGDPMVAADTVNMLIGDLNATMRASDIARSEEIIRQYYKELAASADEPTDVRVHIVTLITEQMKTLVSARATEDYSFRIVDPAYVPEREAAPRRILIVVVGTALGLFAGLLTIFVRRFVADVRKDLKRNKT